MIINTHSLQRLLKARLVSILGAGLGALFIGLVSWELCVAQVQPKVVPEYTIKAAFLYHFTLFIEWPSLGPVDSAQPFDICVLGRDPFGPLLDVLAREHVKGKPVRIMRLKKVEAARSCHVVYVSKSETPQLVAILQYLRGHGILTVGEMDDFAKAGGMIQFISENKKISFAINVSAAQRDRLIISSKLLNLATIVKE